MGSVRAGCVVEVQTPHEPAQSLKSLTIVESPANPAVPHTTVFRWLPILWQTSLFPGDRKPGQQTAPASALWLFLLAALCLFPVMNYALFEPDEGRYAQIPREMADHGDWLVPTLFREPYLDKPPLFYWLVRAMYGIFGASAGAARIIPAISMLALVVATYEFGRRMLGANAAWWGTLFVAISPLFLGMGRLLVLDGLLSFFVGASIYSAYLAQASDRFHRGWWLTAAVTCGLGMLTKGPIAAVLTLPPLIAYRWLAGERTPLTRRHWSLFGIVVGGIALPWYLAIMFASPEFGPYFFFRHNLMRFLEPFDHERPVWFYAPIVLGGMAPVTLLGWRLSRFFLSEDADFRNRRSPATGYLLLSSLWCVFFFSLSGCKLPTYVLPALAPLGLAMGPAIASMSESSSRLGRAWRSAVAWTFVLTCLVGNNFLLPAVARQRSPLRHPEAAALCSDRSISVACFPRNVDSVAFEVGRSDFEVFRSKELPELLEFLDEKPRAVVLFGHRNSKELVLERVPSHLRVVQQGSMGLTQYVYIERIHGECTPRPSRRGEDRANAPTLRIK